MIEATLYGLPMHKVSMPQPQPIGGGGVTATLDDLFWNGMTGKTLSVELTPTRHDTDNGTYFSLGSEVQAWPGRPIQPRGSVVLPNIAGLTPRGQLLIDATYSDITAFDPVITFPITDTSQPEPAYSVYGWYPSKLWAINGFGDQVRSTFVSGQYNPDGSVERVYDSLVLETFYVDETSSDYQAPIVWGHGTEIDQNGVITFAVEVANAVRVLATVNIPNGDGTGALQSYDLANISTNDPSLWVGNINVGAENVSAMEYFVQVMDSSGNVAVTSKEGFHIAGALQPDTIRPINTTRTIDLTLKFDPGDGSGLQPVVGATAVIINQGVGQIVSDSCSTSGTDYNGECQVTITSSQAGNSTLIVQWDEEVSSSTFHYVTSWWAGTISFLKQVEFGPFTQGPQTMCFTLTKTDGGNPFTPVENCFNFSSSNPSRLFMWEVLPAGVFKLTEDVIGGPFEPVTISNISIDDAHQNYLSPRIENVLLPGTLLIEKFDVQKSLWTVYSPPVTFEVYDCGSDLDCTTLETLVATLETPGDGTPPSITLWEGRYLVKEVVPAGYIPDKITAEADVIADQTTTVAFTNTGTRGCSPGFWKNHFELWPSTLDPNNLFSDVFGVTFPGGDITLAQAINLGGGNFEKLARHGTAALVNSMSGIPYPYTDTSVKSLIQTGLSYDGSPGEPEASDLATANNLGCPLH